MSSAVEQAKRHGLHYTPSDLAAFLASRAIKFTEPKPKIRVFDPACGDGELLIAVRDALAQLNDFQDVELHGADRDAEAVRIATSRLPSARLHTLDLVERPEDFGQLGLFDLVITNPPYVRTQVLGSELASRLASKYGLTGRVDLAHAFCAVAPQLLSEHGVLALLCSNRFISTKAGSNVRRLLREEFAVRELYDFGDTKLFGAAVLPAVVIANRGYAGDVGTFTSVYETSGTGPETDLFEAVCQDYDRPHRIAFRGRSFEIRRGSLAADSDYARPWSIKSEDTSTWLATIAKNTWKTFGELAKIRVGIKTTADSVFIRDDWKQLFPSLQPEDDVLLPLLTHRNLTAWSAPTAPAAQVLYPYDLSKQKRTLLDMTRYPRAMEYLQSNRERLSGRKYVVEGGREWFEIWVPQKPALWAKQKIVFPDISETAKFAVDDTGAVVNGDCYWIAGDDIGDYDLVYLMVGVANSELATKFYDITCGNKLYAGRRRWITQYVSNFPLPNPATPASKKIMELARELCAPAVADRGELMQRINEQVEDALLGYGEGE